MQQNLAMLREIAPEKVLRVDANEAWLTKEEALRRIETLARDPHIEFVEQPMPADRPPVETSSGSRSARRCPSWEMNPTRARPM